MKIINLMAAFAMLLTINSAKALNIYFPEANDHRIVFDLNEYLQGGDDFVSIPVPGGYVFVSARCDANRNVAVEVRWQTAAGYRSDTFVQRAWTLWPTGFEGASFRLIRANGKQILRYTYEQ